VKDDGKCEVCPAKQVQHPEDETMCYIQTCSDPREIVMDDGLCKPCPEYQEASMTKTGEIFCKRKVCNSVYEYVSKDSKCIDCRKEKWYNKANEK